MRTMLGSLMVGFVGMTLTTAAAAQKRPDAATMPLNRVRLYETGMAYFERRGALGGDVSLPVPAGHLDDALKTLVVLSEDGQAAVDGIEFASSVSHDMGLALAGLPKSDDGAIDYAHLLESLQGAPVEVRTAKGRFTGRLVDIEAPPAGGHRICTTDNGKETCRSSNHRTLTLLGDGTEIRRFASNEVSSLKPTDPAWRARLGSAMDALSQRGAQTSRKLRVLARSTKPVTLGYIAEAPVWRSTYRLVLASKEGDKDALQGWALLHNDTDEPWKKVKVELVNGRPDSFLFPLAAPRYAGRSLVTPERQLSTVPQLLDKTVDNMWDPQLDNFGESFGAGGLGLSGVGEGGGGRGEGIGLGSVGTIGHGAGSGAGGPGESGLLDVGNLAALANAEGTESASMFRYSLERPIDLRARGSALLPFLSKPIDVVSLAYVDSPGQTARTAVHLTNTTRQTLPAGPISVFADGGFAGETGLSRTKPGDSRILTFGYDLDLELEQAEAGFADRSTVVVHTGDGRLTEHFVRTHHVVYGLTNRSGRKRRVYFPLRYVRNADVAGADALTFDSENNQPIGVLDAPANTRARRTLTVREGLRRNHDVSADAGRAVLTALAKQPGLPPEQRATLRKALGRLDKEAALYSGMKKLAEQIDELDDDRERLREDAKAVGRGSDGAEDIAEKLVEIEAKLKAARKAIRIKTVEAKRVHKRALRGLEALKPPKAAVPVTVKQP
jgi:hypothetical protein